MPIFDMIGCQGTPAGPRPFSRGAWTRAERCGRRRFRPAGL